MTHDERKNMNRLDIIWVEGQTLKAAPWRSTYVLRPDLNVLASSMEDHGWLQPIVVQKKSNMIIDGHHRWEIAGSLKKFTKTYKGLIPVVYEDCSDIEAMMLHLRMNRGRGNVVAKKMSRILRDCNASRKYNEKDFKRILSMHYDEIDIMLDGTLLKSRKVSDHKYSNAWVPVEAPAGAIETAAVIERPPNADR
jgi:ParB-like chromosome segregation protein Spo0J